MKKDIQLPPANQRILVSDTDDKDWFLKGGELAHESLNNIYPDIFNLDNKILDFGCGCSRVLRHFPDTMKLYGTDYNADFYDWNRNNLPHILYNINKLDPPLNYESDFFDVIYSFSVFTHLSEKLQYVWFSELSRILKKDGHLIFSTHGDYYNNNNYLSEIEMIMYNSDKLVVTYDKNREKDFELGGTNICGVFHPVNYVKIMMEKFNFKIIDFKPKGSLGTPYQDLWLVKKI